MLHRFFLILTFLCFAYAAMSETTIDSTKTEDAKKDTVAKSIFKFGLDYVSNNVVMGRASVTAVPTIAPVIKYTFKSGFFVSATLDYLPNNQTKKLDGGDIAAGYDFEITDDLTAGVSYTKLFNSANSTRIGSAISSIFNASLDYDIGTILTPSISMDYNLNKQGIANDKSLEFAISHDFIAKKIFGDEDLVLISPTVAANAGTQNFYDAYLTARVFKSAKRTAAQNALIATFEQNASQFKLLDYEFSVPVEYKAGPFIFQFTPTYAIVENGFKKAATKALGLANQPSVFYFTLGIALKF